MNNNENLFIETVQSTTEYIEKLVQGIKSYIDKDKNVNLFIIVEGLDWVIKSVETISIFQKNKFGQFTQNINSILIQLLEAIENNDEILIKDLLEYEIIPFLEELNDNLKGSLKISN